MIFLEDKLVKVGGVALPGTVKKLEVTTSAAVDEVEVEGLPMKPKQAVGYEDGRVKIELLLDDSPGETLDAKLSRLYGIFRKPGQEIPQPQAIVSKKTAAAGIDRVILENIVSTYNNKSNQETVTLEFCEYIPIPITATSGSAAASAGSAALSGDYQNYLQNSRGSSPLDKTPAVDDRVVGPQLLDTLDSYQVSIYTG